MKIFEYKITGFYNDRPAIAADFVDEVLGFFGGGHTPDVRTGLLALHRVSADGEVLLIRKIQPVRFFYEFDSDAPVFDNGFARSVTTFFGGAHTPAIRGQLLHLERITEELNS